MNSRFVVQKDLGEWSVDRSPGQVETKTGKTNHHRPHSNVQKSSLLQTTHTCINQWKTGFPGQPTGEHFRIVLILHLVKDWIDRRKLHGGAPFQPLNKVIPPVQPRLKGT